MKKASLLNLLMMSIFAFPVFGQQVLWGPKQLEDINMHHSDFVSTNPENCIVLRCDWTADARAFNNFGTYQLDSYDKGFNQIKSVTLVPKLGKQSLRTELGTELHGIPYILSSFGDQKAKRAYYYYQKLDRKTLQLQGTPTKVAEGNHNQFTDPSSIMFRISKDSTYAMLLTYNRLKPFANQLGVHVLDMDMNVAWSKSVTLPLEVDDCVVIDSRVDDLGNAYLMVRSGRGPNDPSPKRDFPRVMNVFVVKNKTGEVLQLPIKADGGSITDVKMDFDGEKGPICVGFYANADPDFSNGYVFYRFNPTTFATEVSVNKPFTSTFLTQCLSKKVEDKAELGLDSYYLRDLVPMDNGHNLLIGERSIEKMGSQSTSFINLEIAAMMFNAKGELVWAKKIPKHQASKESNYYNSFGLFAGTNQVFLLYNEAKENLGKPLELASDDYALPNSQCVVVKATIHADGEIEREVLFPNSAINTMSMPSQWCQSNGKQMIMYAKEFRSYFYGLVTF